MGFNASIDRTVLGLEDAAEAMRKRADRHKRLPESFEAAGEIMKIDLFMVELFIRRLIVDLKKRSEAGIITSKLPRVDSLLRQTCTAVLAARDVLIAEGEMRTAECLVRDFREFSELEVSSETKLIHEKLERWMSFNYHH